MHAIAAGRKRVVNMWDILMMMLKHRTIGYLQRVMSRKVFILRRLAAPTMLFTIPQTALV